MATIEEQTETGPITMTGREGWAEARGNVLGAGVRDIPGQVPPLATAGSLLPPEEAPPVAPGEAAAPSQGPLLDPFDVYDRQITETFNERMARARELREEEAAAAQRAREQLEYGYQRYAEAGQEAVDLAEAQRLRRPPLPTPPTEPAVPVQAIQPFGVGPEKETGMQALHRITGTLGLLAQMGMGMKSGYTRGAMAAYSGALEGWAKGQELAAQKQWREYLANVQKLDREWARERQHFDDILKTDAVDLDRAKLKMAIRQTELGYSKEMVALTFRDVDQRMNMFKIENDLLQNLQKDSLSVMTNRMLASFRERQQNEVEAWHRSQALHQKAVEQATALRDAATIANQQAQRALQAREATERERHHRAMEGIQAAKPAGGVTGQQMATAATTARESLSRIKAILADPKQAQDLRAYQGMGGQWLLDLQSGTTLLPEPPQAAVDASQALATIQNNVLNIISGKQVAQHEERRLYRMMPKLGSRPEVFAREVQNIESYINELMAKPNRGEATTVNNTNAPMRVRVQGPNGPGTYVLDPGEALPTTYRVVQ